MRLGLATLLLLSAAACQAQIVKLAELNTEQVSRLDRDHTVVLLTDGIMEEHGPYMPSYTDGYVDEALTADLARTIVAQPGWTVALFPAIPLGTSPANVLAHQYVFGGSYTVSERTMRSIYMDLGDAFGRLGFRHIFVVDGHGGPSNNLALDVASDYFHDTYGGTMTHLLGTMQVFDCCHDMEETMPKEQLAQNGLEVHAGIFEQSQILFLRPDLAPSGYLQSRSNGRENLGDLEREAMKPGWMGYLGAPRYATAALGARYYQAVSAATNKLALDILNARVDPYKLERYSTVLMQATETVEQPLRTHEAEQERMHASWLAAHGLTLR